MSMLAPVVPYLVGGAAAVATNKLIGGGGGGEKMDFTPTPLPQPPKADEAVSKAQEDTRRRRAAVTQTIYSSPLGLSDQANVARKVLLGQ